MNKKLILLVLPFFFLASCNGNDDPGADETRTYEDYKATHYRKIDDFYSGEGKYCIYFYQVSCSHCTNIKSDVFNYMDAQDAGKKSYFNNFYFYCLSGSSTGEGKLERGTFDYKSPSNLDTGTSWSVQEIESFVKNMQTNKVNTTAETCLFGTPSLYIIENNCFGDLVYGETNIKNFLGTH